METFDAIVIGAGEAGTEVAARAMDDGHRVALIYKAPYGSTCLNVGCVPSKFLIERARAAFRIRTAGRYHIRTSAPQVDLAAIVREKNDMIRTHRAESLQAAEAAASDGLMLIEAEAFFAAPHEVVAGGRRLQADRIFIATGMRPSIPSLPGLQNVPFLTSDSVMDLEKVPGHLVIIGGGYIACELGQVYRRFGGQVTVIQQAPHLCAGEEPRVSSVLEEAFEQEEIVAWLQHRPVAVESISGGVRIAAAAPDGHRRTVEGTHLLIAAGRRANTDTLRLDAAGIETDARGFIRVTDLLETTAPGVWAIGDVNGLQPFTRVCQEEGKIAYANAFHGTRLRVNRRALGHGVFTDPEIGSVGYLERDVPEPFDPVTVVVGFDQVARAELSGERRGFIKLVADRETRLLLGCHIVGPQAAELVYDAALVIRNEGRIDDMAQTVGIFPTLQESIEGTARALLRSLDPDRARGPLAAA